MRALLLAGLVIAASALYILHLPSGPYLPPIEIPEGEPEETEERGFFERL